MTAFLYDSSPGDSPLCDTTGRSSFTPLVQSNDECPQAPTCIQFHTCCDRFPTRKSHQVQVSPISAAKALARACSINFIPNHPLVWRPRILRHHLDVVSFRDRNRYRNLFGWLLRDTSSLSEVPVLFRSVSSWRRIFLRLQSLHTPHKKISCLRRLSGPPGQAKTKEPLCSVRLRVLPLVSPRHNGAESVASAPVNSVISGGPTPRHLKHQDARRKARRVARAGGRR